MSDQLEWFEQQLARLENRHEQLREAFHAHAAQAVHPSFTDSVQEIRSDLKVLQTRWLQVGGAVIALLLGILGALLRPPTPSVMTVAPTRVTCAQFASQAAAQAFYRDNPVAGLVLDGDRDGLACQTLPLPRDGSPVSP